MKPSKRSQQGLGLISAIFVITTLALLVAGYGRPQPKRR